MRFRAGRFLASVRFYSIWACVRFHRIWRIAVGAGGGRLFLTQIQVRFSCNVTYIQRVAVCVADKTYRMGAASLLILFGFGALQFAPYQPFARLLLFVLRFRHSKHSWIELDIQTSSSVLLYSNRREVFFPNGVAGGAPYPGGGIWVRVMGRGKSPQV